MKCKKILTSIGIPELTSPTMYVRCLSVWIKAERKHSFRFKGLTSILKVVFTMHILDSEVGDKTL